MRPYPAKPTFSWLGQSCPGEFVRLCPPCPVAAEGVIAHPCGLIGSLTIGGGRFPASSGNRHRCCYNTKWGPRGPRWRGRLMRKDARSGNPESRLRHPEAPPVPGRDCGTGRGRKRRREARGASSARCKRAWAGRQGPLQGPDITGQDRRQTDRCNVRPPKHLTSRTTVVWFRRTDACGVFDGGVQ